MDSELLKQLITNPARWPFYLLVAVIVIVVLKFINVGADAIAKRFADKLRQKKGLLTLCKATAQVLAIALVIYISNGLYWSRAMRHLAPSLLKKPINTCEVTVEIRLESEDQQNSHFIDSGGYLAFGRGDQSVLMAVAPDSWGRPVASNQYLSRGLFKMDVTDSGAGKPVEMLRQAEYIQIEFHRLPKDYTLIDGKALCIINSDLRLEIPVPAQKAVDGKVYVRDLKSFRAKLK